MGDVPHDSTVSGPPRQHHQATVHDDSSFSAPKPSVSSGPSSGGSRPSSGAPFYSQYSTLPAPQHPQSMSSGYSQHVGNPYPSPNHAGSGFDMNAVASALPVYASHNTSHIQPHQQQSSSQRISGASTPAVVYQLQQNLQYPHQTAPSHWNPAPFGVFAPPPYHGYTQQQSAQAAPYAQFGHAQQGFQQPFAHYPQLSPQYYQYPGAMGGGVQQVPQSGPFPNQAGQFQEPYHMRPGVGSSQQFDSRTMHAFGGQGDPYTASQVGVEDYHGSRRRPSEGSLSAIPRGPPRKPKQSGHALWVGNLPPGATVIDLKDHFSRNATRDIESLFLISKSNCAFVNYRTEAACAAAMQRFHDSRFHGVRLVCRLRRSSAAASGIPTAPAMISDRTLSMTSSMSKSPLLDNAEGVVEEPEREHKEEPESDPLSLEKVAEKFFIVKSLTLQDLEQSALNGIWATQAHNEEALNKAYKAAGNVYLIFSANKSGEYFGYARMASPINADAAEIYRSIPQPEPIQSSETPKTIPTPATEFAPKGRIIDDSARGTIFWEAELTEPDEEDEDLKSGDDAPDGTDGAPQAWGKPFKVEWMSTNRLPFYRTRGLRNPWNANREVKIARDGTELETGVGKRLLQMFHRPAPASTAGSQNLPMSPGRTRHIQSSTSAQSQY